MDKAIDPQIWLAQAKLELEVAKHLEQEFIPKPLEIICFHAQQTAEKAIKAVILHSAPQNSIAKTHDISFLLNSIDRDKYPFEEVFFDYSDELFPYSVATRYPNMLQDSIDEYKTTQALNHAEEILHWAAKVIKQD